MCLASIRIEAPTSKERSQGTFHVSGQCTQGLPPGANGFAVPRGRKALQTHAVVADRAAVAVATMRPAVQLQQLDCRWGLISPQLQWGENFLIQREMSRATVWQQL